MLSMSRCWVYIRKAVCKGSARPGPYAGSMSFLFIIVPIPSLVGPLYRPKSHVSFPKRRSQRGVGVSRA